MDVTTIFHRLLDLPTECAFRNASKRTPSVEASLGDFFGIGHVNFHGLPHDIPIPAPFLVRAPE